MRGCRLRLGNRVPLAKPRAPVEFSLLETGMAGLSHHLRAEMSSVTVTFSDLLIGKMPINLRTSQRSPESPEPTGNTRVPVVAQHIVSVRMWVPSLAYARAIAMPDPTVM